MIIDTSAVEMKKGNCFSRDARFGFWTLLLLRKGSLEFSVSRKEKVVVESPTMVLLHPKHAFRAAALDATELFYVIFTPQDDWLGHMQFGEQLPGCMVLPLESYGEVIYDVVAEIAHYWKKHDGTSYALAMNALEKALLLADRANPYTSSIWEWNDRINAAVKIIESNVIKTMTVKDLADQVGMSESHFAHLFRRETGCSPIRFQQRYRVQCAKRLLLSTDLKIQDIAEKVGFINAFHFSTRFRKHTGQTPSQFRKYPVATN